MKRYSPKDPAHVGGAAGGELAREQGRLGRCRLCFMRPKVAEPGAEGAEGGEVGGEARLSGWGEEGEGRGWGWGFFPGWKLEVVGGWGWEGGIDAIVCVYFYIYIYIYINPFPRRNNPMQQDWHLLFLFTFFFFSHWTLVFATSGIEGRVQVAPC